MCWRNFDFYYKDLIYKVIMNYIIIKIKFNKIITYQKYNIYFNSETKTSQKYYDRNA